MRRRRTATPPDGRCCCSESWNDVAAVRGETDAVCGAVTRPAGMEPSVTLMQPAVARRAVEHSMPSAHLLPPAAPSLDAEVVNACMGVWLDRVMSRRRARLLNTLVHPSPAPNLSAPRLGLAFSERVDAGRDRGVRQAACSGLNAPTRRWGAGCYAQLGVYLK
jgi:hypothetical protein